MQGRPGFLLGAPAAAGTLSGAGRGGAARGRAPPPPNALCVAAAFQALFRASRSTPATRVPLPPLGVVGRETQARGTTWKPCVPPHSHVDVPEEFPAESRYLAGDIRLTVCLLHARSRRREGGRCVRLRA